MRHLFGLGTRAEVIRYLISATVTDASALSIADAAAFAKRNVNETLTSLVASRIVTAHEHGNERRYYLDRAMWGQLLRFQPDTWPRHRDWPRLLSALRQISRWLRDPALGELTPYMLASNARTLLKRLEPDLAPAGISSEVGQVVQGEDYWATFVTTVERSLVSVEQAWPE
jgi:hypothetical protein